MRQLIRFVLLSVAFVGVAATPADARKWTDRTGQQIEADFVGFADGKVEIKRNRDGKTFHVALERFSDADQAFVRSQTQASPSPPKPTSTRQASKSSGLPVAPAKPAYQNVPGTQPAVPAPTTPKIGGPLTFQVKSVKTQNSYSHSFGGGQSNTQAKAGFTFLLVNVSVQNTSAEQETFSSPSFRIVDDTGKPVDATFLGVDDTICMSGKKVMNGWSSISVGGDTVVRFKGMLDSNEPKNSRIDWELAPSKSYTATFMFVIPDQTQRPRFEMAKNVTLKEAKVVFNVPAARAIPGPSKDFSKDLIGVWLVTDDNLAKQLPDAKLRFEFQAGGDCILTAVLGKGPNETRGKWFYKDSNLSLVMKGQKGEPLPVRWVNADEFSTSSPKGDMSVFRRAGKGTP